MTASQTPLEMWTILTTDVPSSGFTQSKAANRDERVALKAALDLIDCEAMSFEYTLKPASEGRYRLKGKLTARVVQTCVVTLEPVTNTITDRVMAEFLPAQDMPAEIGGSVDLDDDYDEEPIIDQRIDIGRVVYEHLASALDPYPRKEGAAVDWTPLDGAMAKENPFAVLAKLKDTGKT